MKKLFLLIVLCVCSLRAYSQAPPIFHEEGRYFGVNAGDFICETWGDHITKTNKSLFHGYSYSLQIGMYF